MVKALQDSIAQASERCEEKRSLVSVIIPTHNRARLLRGAINSVLSQDGQGELFELEVIVVDDLSSDDTSDVVAQYPSIRYIRLETNKKSSAARNVGIKACSGKYIAFLDDDDIWLPHRLGVQVPILENSPNIGALYGQGLAVNPKGDVMVWPSSGASGKVFEHFLTRDDDFVNVDTWLIRREAFDKAGLFDESLPVMEHFEMAVRLAFHVDWAFLPGAVCYGRILSEGLWVTNVLNGTGDKILTRIMEKVLAWMPYDNYHNGIRIVARAAGTATLADQLWHYAGALSVRKYLLEAIGNYPEILDTPQVRSRLHRLARELGVHAKTPCQEMRRLCNDLQLAMGSRGGKNSFAELLAQAAIEFRRAGSPRQAILVSLCAILHDFSYIWHSLRIIAGSLIDRIRRSYPRPVQ